MRVEPFAGQELGVDDFLGGRVRLWQPKTGYRAGTDPVLLAASVEATAGQSVLELGCGAGTALCCLGKRIEGLSLFGIEVQPAYADLAQQNLVENGLSGRIWQGDIMAPPDDFRAQSFDHVIANPPYFEPNRRKGVEDEGRELGLAGATPLGEWVKLAAKRLKPKGTATFIQRAERLPDLLVAMEGRLGSVELLPLISRLGRAPRLILVRCRKNGRGAFKFHAAQMIHAAAQHLGGSGDYVPEIKAVFEEGAPLSFPKAVG